MIDMKSIRHPIGLILSGLILLLCSVCTTIMVLWTAPVDLGEILTRMEGQPILFVLNLLPIFLLTLAFSFLLRGVFFSAALVTLVTVVMGVGNRIKLQVRDEPFLPKDLVLLKEAADAAGSYDLTIPWNIVGGAALFALFCVLLGLLFPLRRRETGTFCLRSWLVRLGGGSAALGILTGAVVFLYSSDTLYMSLPASNRYYLPSVCNDLGFPYFFCYHFSTYQLTKPEGYDKGEVQAYETGDCPSPGADVNVVIVMNEAFSDLTNHEVFTYTQEEDPLQNFNALCASERAVSGYIVVPNFAGGTANTEFDVMTGMQTNSISTSGSSFRTFNRNLDSILRVYRSSGYHTLFMHPGQPWFYNRENVYDYLGADEQMFIEDFADAQYKGSWMTDEAVKNNLIKEFEQTVSAGERFCGFAVTIQNHMSYTSEKYGPDYVFPPVQTDAPISDQAKTLLSVYIEGLRDADRMLGDLASYFEASSEPVVLLFYGDHLPYLGDGRLAYRELGLPAGTQQDGASLAAYQTPYLIWYNEAAASELGNSMEELALPEDGVISASFLGPVLLELTGHREDSPWFSFLSDLRKEIPVAQNDVYHDSEGVLSGGLTQKQEELMEKWRNWSYYKLSVKKVS